MLPVHPQAAGAQGRARPLHCRRARLSAHRDAGAGRARRHRRVDLPAYANGQRFLFNHGPERKRFSDPDASWGHRSAIATRKGGGFYGYKVHAAVDAATGLPLSWTVATARDAEVPVVPGLLNKLAGYGIRPAVAIADKGYDVGPF
ncbi:MAG: transposase, partial [Actinobacteria bacterium]|nr:transposase [Actinomycetota bacterium]